MKKRAIPEIITFSIGLPKKMQYSGGKEMDTGICKESIEEAFLEKDGFYGDGVSNTRYHGGVDRAVCIYPYEHYLLWEEEFKTALPSSTFGENLTVTNMLEKDVHIGDIFEIGEATIQITQGRIPCDTINKRTGIPLLNRMVETGFTGYLCRVLKEGTVRKDSKITLIEPHPKQISVQFGNDLYFHSPQDVEGIKKILAVEELADNWREKLNKRLAKLNPA